MDVCAYVYGMVRTLKFVCGSMWTFVCACVCGRLRALATVWKYVDVCAYLRAWKSVFAWVCVWKYVNVCACVCVEGYVRLNIYIEIYGCLVKHYGRPQ